MTQDFLEALPQHIVKLVDNLDLVERHEHYSQREEAVESVLEQTVLRGGKRLRPLLTFLMGEFLGASSQQIIPFAKASELVHAASLAHDDVIDQAQTRRGQSSINVVSSNKKAILAGDYLLADVIVALSHYGTPEILREMSLVIQELSLGEWLQLETSQNKDYTAEKIENMARYKTSSVIRWCSVAPALLAQHPPEVIEECRSFGDQLGLAFQLIDDTLDFAKSSAKDQYLDLNNGQVNSVVFSWLSRHPETFAIYKASSGEGVLAKLLEGADLSDDITKVRAQAHEHLEACQANLDRLEELLRQQSSDKTEDLSEKRESLNLVLAFLAARNS